MVPIVLQVLVHAGVLYSDMEWEEPLNDLGTLGANVPGRAVAQEEADHLNIERLGGDVERREAVPVPGVGIGAEAAHLASRALQRCPGTAHGVLGDHGDEDLRVEQAPETHVGRDGRIA